MSYDLYAWKAPIASEDEASPLVRRFYDENDVDVFEPSEDVLRFYDELLEMYRALESDQESDDGPTRGADTPERSDRIVDLSFSWSVPDNVLDDVVALARKHELVLYDPQGPCFYSPIELLVEPRRRDPAVLRQALVGLLIGVAVLVIGLVMPLRVLDWILIVAGGFIVVMGIYSVVAWLRE